MYGIAGSVAAVLTIGLSALFLKPVSRKRSAYIMEKDSMNSEEAMKRVRTDLYPTQVPRREPLPEMRFQHGGMSMVEIQEKKWRTPEEILGIPLPKAVMPTQEKRH